MVLQNLTYGLGKDTTNNNMIFYDLRLHRQYSIISNMIHTKNFKLFKS